MNPTQAPHRVRWLASTIALALAVAIGVLCVMQAESANAQTEEELLGQKAYWQQRYRALRSRVALLRENARISRYNYEQAQQRNYPRGAIKEQWLKDAADAEKQLESLEEELAGFNDMARREGALPGWLYEVEDEPMQALPSESPANQADDAEDREGRNPLYLDVEDDA